MRTVIFMVIAFALGIAFEKFNRWALEDNCPRVYIGYNCRGKNCQHTDEAWDAVRGRRNQIENNYDEEGFWRGKE